MTFFVTLAAAKSIAARCYFPTPRRARSTFFTLFNAAAEVAADLRGSGREGGEILFSTWKCVNGMPAFPSCASSWDGGRRPCKKGDVICFNFLLFIQKCEVQWFVIQGPILMKKQKNEKIGLSNNNQGSTLSYISIYKPTVRAASPPLLPSILSSALLSPKSS